MSKDAKKSKASWVKLSQTKSMCSVLLSNDSTVALKHYSYIHYILTLKCYNITTKSMCSVFLSNDSAAKVGLY